MATSPTPPRVPVVAAARLIDRIGTRLPPTTAVSCGVGVVVSMVKSVSATRVAPRVRVTPPPCSSRPAKSLRASDPPETGNTSCPAPLAPAGDTGAAVMPTVVSVEARAGSSVTEVENARAVTCTVPRRVPVRNTRTPKARFSAPAACGVRVVPTPPTVMNRPSRMPTRAREVLRSRPARARHPRGR